MDNLHIEGTRSTPEVRFDASTGTLSLSGESYPENTFDFYRPVLAWLDRFLHRCNGPVTMEVMLSYLNTGSTKCMLDILDSLESACGSGKRITINWYCDRQNERAFDTAEEFKEEVTMEFNIIPFEERS